MEQINWMTLILKMFFFFKKYITAKKYKQLNLHPSEQHHPPPCFCSLKFKVTEKSASRHNVNFTNIFCVHILYKIIKKLFKKNIYIRDLFESVHGMDYRIIGKIGLSQKSIFWRFLFFCQDYLWHFGRFERFLKIILVMFLNLFIAKNNEN
jgi:hypothetical protein